MYTEERQKHKQTHIQIGQRYSLWFFTLEHYSLSRTIRLTLLFRMDLRYCVELFPFIYINVPSIHIG